VLLPAYVAARCSVIHVCCSVLLQCVVAVCCSVLQQCVAVNCSSLISFDECLQRCCLCMLQRVAV